MPTAIIIGATSGIGLALAHELARHGYTLGLTGRREAILEELRTTLPTRVAWRDMDLTRPEEATTRLDSLIAELGGMDLLIVSSGVCTPNSELAWEPERDTLAVNVSGFVAMISAGFRYFSQQGHGHLVGLSSIAGIRGNRWNPAYAASKAFEINYLEGVRGMVHRLRLPITVTDIRPGFVATPMTAHNPRMFWLATTERAAEQIYQAIRRKARYAYITRRWAIIAWLLRHLPTRVLERI